MPRFAALSAPLLVACLAVLLPNGASAADAPGRSERTWAPPIATEAVADA